MSNPNVQELVAGFVLEMRRGMIVLAVLAKLETPTYGYSLIGELADTGIAIEANTLYPLLRRLEGQGLLESSWNTEGAKPRKYYTNTTFGQEVLAELKAQWNVTSKSMNKLLRDTRSTT
ncbi:MAG: PadR family transcriptional regulator [Coriobacteriia bacterium]|nr:PadR family transcriptional regulator [Coriobacteriia bacterium]